MFRLYHVYILASHSRVIYVGITGDLGERLAWHRSSVNSASFTSRYNVRKLVYVEEYTDPGQAIAREKQIKSWRREKKVRLIQRNNPHWIDLAPPVEPTVGRHLVR